MTNLEIVTREALAQSVFTEAEAEQYFKTGAAQDRSRTSSLYIRCMEGRQAPLL